MPRNAPNRTDLLTPGPSGPPPGMGQPNGQPIQVPTGGPYGEAQALQQAQQAVPVPQAPGTGAPSAPSGFNMGSAMAAARSMTPPNLPPLTGPTARPNEPVTAGLPGSPAGAGNPRVTGSLASMISAVAQASNSSSLSQLAARAAAAGQ